MSKLALLRASVIGLALAMSIPWIALADNYTVDGDLIQNGNQNIVAVTLKPGQSATVATLVTVGYQGQKHLMPGTAFTLGFDSQTSTAPSGGSVTGTGAAASVPNPWAAGASFTMSVTATVTAPATDGTYAFTAKWAGTSYTCEAGTSPASGCVTGAAALNVNFTADGTGPVITVPANISVPATSAAGAAVTYAASATDAVDGARTVTCTPPSGSTFPAAQTTTVTCVSADKLGNASNATFTVTVGPWDTTPPVITATISPAANGNGWHNGDATVSWTVMDSESAFTTTGCATTTLTASGSLTCSATSDGGTASATASVQIDALLPTITAAATTAPNEAGWYRTDVSIAFSCADAGGSGLDGSCPGAQTLSASGSSTAQIISDRAGNSATSNTVAVQIDKDAPTVAAAIAPAPNANGWNNTDVTVTFACTDALSGCTSASEIVPVADEGTTSLTSSEFTDLAGNGGGYGTATVKIDKTVPTIEVSASAGNAPYAGGWTNQDVIVSFTCNDTGSGVAGGCPSAQTLEQTGSSTAQTIQDNAGNGATSGTISAQIDKIVPTISAAASTGAGAYTTDTWTNQDVTITFACGDQGGSGLAGTCPETETLTVSGSSSTPTVSDNAGNTSAPSNGFIVKIDKDAPEISGTATGTQGTNGWYTSDVTVTFLCTDALSGIASCTEPQTVSAEGTTGSASGTAVDNAGNSSSTSVNGIKIDKTGPSMTVTGAGDTYALGGKPSATCTDSTAGLAGGPIWTTTTAPNDPNGFGSWTGTFTCTDNAGNTTTSGPVTYNVSIEKSLSCFISPIKTDQTYSAKAGSTIPMKCQLTSTLARPDQVVLNVVAKRVTLTGATDINEIDAGSANGNSTVMRYSPSLPGYIFNWRTAVSNDQRAKALDLGTYTFEVSVGGTALSFKATVTLTK
jgi:hypothetical protein